MTLKYEAHQFERFPKQILLKKFTRHIISSVTADMDPIHNHQDEDAL